MVALGADWGGEWEDPTSYLYDRPFLLVMQKRGSSRPFFVMWVENAELLQRH
jgi:hypothetical protein